MMQTDKKEWAAADPISTISEVRLQNHIQALEGEKDPEHSPDALKAAADYLSNQMRTLGLNPIESPISAKVDAKGEPCFNIIGQLPEASIKGGILVIGAHYDTVPGSPGADDNASGLAVLLEVARVITPMWTAMRGRCEEGPVPQFVAFSLEEAGFIGSEAYLKEAERAGIPVWGAIILECVGYTDDKTGSQNTPPGLPFSLPDQGNFIGLLGNDSAEPIKKAFESALSTVKPVLPHQSLVVPGNGEAIPDARRSDHVPFWDRGVPAVMLTDTANFRNPHYHQSTDRLETLNLGFMTGVAKTLAATVIQLCGRDLHDDEN